MTLLPLIKSKVSYKPMLHIRCGGLRCNLPKACKPEFQHKKSPSHTLRGERPSQKPITS
jgi:hypothetical protein